MLKTFMFIVIKKVLFTTKCGSKTDKEISFGRAFWTKIK